MIKLGTSALLTDRQRDRNAIAAISAGHFYSHFGILILPPLFPLLKDVFDVSYTSLGLALACLNLATLLLQAPCGALVDRVGGYKILIGGHLLMAGSIMAVGLTDSYLMLLLLMVLAGIGNAVYHPADYAILSARISPSRLGRAFSIHTAGGHFGFAAAPFLIVRFEQWFGWQGALIAAGLFGVAIGGLIIWFRSSLEAPDAPHAEAPGGGFGAHIRLLTSFPVLAALAFFTMIAVSQGGYTGFSASSFALLYDLDLQAASWPLTLFLTLSAVGVLTGGWIADRLGHHARVCAVCYGLMAVFTLPLALVDLSFGIVTLLFAGLGFANGFLSPARDLLVRSITPDGRAGIVFGFVTTGFNIGGLIAPVLFGAILDLFAPTALYAAIAFSCLITVITVYVGQAGRRASVS